MLKARQERDKTWNETLKEGAALGNQWIWVECLCCSTVQRTKKRLLSRDTTRRGDSRKEILH